MLEHWASKIVISSIFRIVLVISMAVSTYVQIAYINGFRTVSLVRRDYDSLHFSQVL